MPRLDDVVAAKRRVQLEANDEKRREMEELQAMENDHLQRVR